MRLGWVDLVHPDDKERQAPVKNSGVSEMIDASVERNPRFWGKVKSFDDTAAKACPSDSDATQQHTQAPGIKRMQENQLKYRMQQKRSRKNLFFPRSFLLHSILQLI